MNFLDWQRYNHTFQSLVSYRDDDFNCLGSGDPERLHGKMISAGFFEVLGVSPRLGRTFLTEEDALGARPVVVISSSFWRRHFAAAANVLSRSLTLNGRDHAVVGVIAGDLPLGGPADVFVPIGQWDEKMFRERKFSFDTRVIGRLKRGARREEAIADLDAVGRQLAAAYPDANANTGITVIPLKQDLVGSFRGKLQILLGAVSFVLLIACANVGNLLLARASKRGPEVAVRVALGASSFRIVRQLLTESVLLGLVGGVLGLLLAASLTRVALTALPSAIPRGHSIQIDVYVFAFALATSVFAGILFGLVPALKAGDPDLQQMLKEGGRGNSGTRHRAQSLFVVAEISLALVLLAGAGLMIRSLARLARVDPGFDPRNVLVFRVALSPEYATQPAQIRVRFKQILETLEALPGVQSASLMMGAVPMTDYSEIPFWLDGESKPASQSEMHWTLYYFVSPAYFHLMRVPLLRGRSITAHDSEAKPLIALIDEEMAAMLFPNQDPIGKRLNINFIGTAQIVGIVGHVKHWGLDSDLGASVRAQTYLPYRQIPDQYLPLETKEASLLVRTLASPLSLAASIRRSIQSLDSRQIMYSERTLEGIVGNSLVDRRFEMILLGAFGALALLLAAVGTYGVLSCVVAGRVREIGVRMALGAGPRAVLRLVLVQGAKLILAGTFLGLIGAAALTRLISGMLYGVSATDPVTFALVALLLASVGVLACYVPARRATRVDPLVALQHE